MAILGWIKKRETILKRPKVFNERHEKTNFPGTNLIDDIPGTNLVDDTPVQPEADVFVTEVPEKTNFPGNHKYTLNAITEELALMERHLRDGSWKLCDCNPEKHLPTIAGLASEGFGFAETVEEKEFMKELRDNARKVREYIATGKFMGKDAEELRAWAREARHRLTSGEFSTEKVASNEEESEDCPTCKRAVSFGWALGAAERMKMPDAEQLRSEVEEERLSVPDGIDKIIEYAKSIGNETEAKYLEEVKRLMNTTLPQS